MPFTLINPYINNLNFSSSKKSADLAAEDIWNKFSKNITEYVPNFNFTVKNNSDNSLYHYNVKENLENENVKYTISNLSGSNKYDKELLADFNNSKKMKGGKRYDSSSSSSSSSSDANNYTFKSNKSSVLYIDPVLTYNPLYNVPITSSLWLPKYVLNPSIVGITTVPTVPTVATIRINGIPFLFN